MRMRRIWIRARRRMPGSPEELEKRSRYKEAKKQLGKAISKAKSEAWRPCLAIWIKIPGGLHTGSLGKK